MKTYTTVENQSWFDLAIQLLGDPSRAMELCLLNGFSFVNTILPGIEIMYPEASPSNDSNGWNNTLNNVPATSQNQILLSNSFSNDFNLNEFV